ncbi:U4/U6 small nuclear ribonucleoprotein Prp3 [Colletotrichum tofieldiae]|uniref:U4/U6 small nuclear ribonucleoprotein Prp3 (Pre-mRNA processing factor 3) n=1 Tax=Colletotrichum tofieldiae TaxID=708197 RepID=A0A166MW35_9PEZI|nr:U4/U6 small nuclear ribonucleoprotein Prp3 (pre-mRNA processing factor 3) [Colletotrichum tofieldiae]GKT57274.1 U4/U6 small nuclear ribonucleoprotein Prp3 [Colletotrichum tofieldiae]GKT79005.1 U4/U6 small nuclear ribonucleoprotein Prp3 [Colletotrichum tofieldiae]
MDRRPDLTGLGPRHDPNSRVSKPESAADKMAALKARVAAAIGGTKAKGGLNVGLHPVLEGLGQAKPPGRTSDAKPSGSRSQFEASAANVSGYRTPDVSGYGRDGPKSNPYFNEQLAAQPAGGKQRQARPLHFHPKGKFIQQAAALRRQAALEEMKKRIAAQTRKAGIEDEMDMEKNLVVEAPPDIEWFDEGLVDGTYDNIEEESRVKINKEDTIVTEYIQHPVALEPPQEKNTPAVKPMYLTSKEQKKLRRQRRMAELKEQQAKIRLGLVPAPPPKVKKSNMMRVYADSAVKDPTAVENLVNRQIAERQQNHLQANEERKLTKEEKHDKLATNQEKDAAKGIHVLVFKINSLANGQHRFKIQKNAEQHALTGLCVMHPKTNLVIVEGGEHSIRKYKKLMLDRIDWTENTPSREGKTQQQVREWLVAENEKGDLKDMSHNECKLVFEGEEKTRAFRKWGNKVCESDAEAKDALARAKMENFWALAKSM